MYSSDDRLDEYLNEESGVNPDDSDDEENQKDPQVDPSMWFYIKLFISLFGFLFGLLWFSTVIEWCFVLDCEHFLRREMCNELSPRYNESPYRCETDNVTSPFR